MKNNTFKEIWDKFKGLENVVIPLHLAPDGDSLGSCTALKYLLEKKFKTNVKIISKDKLDESLMKISFTKEIEFGKGIDDINLEKTDAVIMLDFGSLEGFTKKDNLKNQIINLDHHETNQYFGNLNYVDSNRATACSVLIDLFKDRNVRFDKELSQRLLLGICTDSGFFTNTNAEDALNDASYLIKNGANYLGIVDNVLGKTPLRMKKYYAYLIDNLKINNEQKFAYTLIPKTKITEFGLNLAEIRLGINQIKNIEGIDIVCTLSEIEYGIKGSFRSNTKDIDVSKYAKKFGGGGHKVAAAFYLPKMSLEEAEKKVKEIFGK